MERRHSTRLRAAAAALALATALTGTAVALAAPASATYGIPITCPSTDPGGHAGIYVSIDTDEEHLHNGYSVRDGQLLRALEQPRGPVLTCFYRGTLVDHFYHQTVSWALGIPGLWPTIFESEVTSTRPCTWWVEYRGPNYTRTFRYNWTLSTCGIPAGATG